MILDFSDLSVHDVRQIEIYSEERWGPRHALKYISQLRAVVFAIQAGSEPGRPFHLPQRTLRRTLVGKHHIYFERSDDLVFISRVLHGAMNVYLLEFPANTTLNPNE